MSDKFPSWEVRGRTVGPARGRWEVMRTEVYDGTSPGVRDVFVEDRDHQCVKSLSFSGAVGLPPVLPGPSGRPEETLSSAETSLPSVVGGASGAALILRSQLSYLRPRLKDSSLGSTDERSVNRHGVKGGDNTPSILVS